MNCFFISEHSTKNGESVLARPTPCGYLEQRGSLVKIVDVSFADYIQDNHHTERLQLDLEVGILPLPHCHQRDGQEFAI